MSERQNTPITRCIILTSLVQTVKLYLCIFYFEVQTYAMCFMSDKLYKLLITNNK